MKARLFTNILRRGHVAADYVRLVERTRQRSPTETNDPNRRQAQQILETVQNDNKPDYELDINIAGKDLIWQLDHDFESIGLVPYFFSDAARVAGEGIAVGSCVTIPGDDRKFMTVAISRRKGSVRIRDTAGNEYLIPWQLARPWRE
jgi:hypothetical protein